MNGTAVSSGVFVSDLHLFSPRSAGERTRRQLVDFSDPEQCIVLGGDIFDFRWSDKGSHLATLDAAQGWIEDLLATTGDSQIIFLPGNHDCHPDFLRRLAEIAQHDHRFRWRDHHVQIGDSLFLHGDILDAKGNWGGLDRYRLKFHHGRPQTRVAHRAYDVAVGMRMHKLVPLVRHPPRMTCERLWGLVHGIATGGSTPVKRVYFGHTHVPISALECNDVQFFNPGAALKHMRPRIQHFNFDAVIPWTAPCNRSRLGETSQPDA